MDVKTFMTRVDEQVEQFEDMVDQLKHILKEKVGDLSAEGCYSISVGFNNHIGRKRTKIRIIAANPENLKYIKILKYLR